MDRIPPSICPTGIYRCPSRAPTLADVGRPLSPSDRRPTVGLFGALRALAHRLGRPNVASERQGISRG